MKYLEWTPELVRRFWNQIADTRLAEISFSRQAGTYLLAALRSNLKAGGRHLDFGAGDGDLTLMLAKKGYATAAFEPAADRRDVLVARLRNEPKFIGVVDSQSREIFDVVLMIEVIEHVLEADLDATLRQVNRMLPPGGTLIVSTPNNEDLDLSMAYCPVSDTMFHRWQHVRSFTVDTLTSLLSRYGFRSVAVHQLELTKAAFDDWQSSPHLVPFRRLREAIARHLERRMYRRLAHNNAVTVGAGSTIVYIGRRSNVRDLPASGVLPSDANVDAHRIGLAVSDHVGADVAAILAETDRLQLKRIGVALNGMPRPDTWQRLQADSRVAAVLIPTGAERGEVQAMPNILRYGFGKIEDMPTSGMPADLILAGQNTWIRWRLGWHMHRAGIRRVLARRGGKFVSRSTLTLAAMHFVRVLIARTQSTLIRATRGLRVKMLRQPTLAGVMREIRYLEQRVAESVGISGLGTSTDTLAKLPPLLAAEQFVSGRVVLVNGGLAWGGVERQIVYLLRHLALRPSVESVTLVCQNLFDIPGCDFYLPKLKDAPADVVEAASAADDGILVAACQNNPDVAGFIANLPLELQVEVRRFAIEFLRRRPAIVHAFQDTPSAAAGLAAVVVGVPRIILSSRNMRPTNFAYYRSYLLPTYRALAACERVVFSNNSDAGAADYAHWIGLPRSKFQVVRNGIAGMARPDSARVAAFRASLGVPEGAPLIGSVFRFYTEKRPMLWIETAGRLARGFPGAHFLIVGTGPMHEKMARRAKYLGIADRLHMPGTMHDIPVAISAMSVFVLTSEFEGTPNVVLEAGLMGVPVVATDAGGTGETIDQGRTGWCVPERDAVSIAARVTQILRDAAWAAAAREIAPEFICSRFGLDRMIDEVIAQYGLASTVKAHGTEVLVESK